MTKSITDNTDNQRKRKIELEHKKMIIEKKFKDIQIELLIKIDNFSEEKNLLENKIHTSRLELNYLRSKYENELAQLLQEERLL